MTDRIQHGAAPTGPEPSQVETGKPLTPGGTLRWNLPPSSKRSFGNYAGAFDDEAAPCDGSPEGSETRSGSTEGNSAVEFANSEVEAPASQDLKALQAENERLTAECNEAHTEVTDMMWQRRRAEERAEAAEAALAESERKRVEADTVSVPRLCDVEALFAYYAVMDAGQRCHERTICAINAYVAEAARLATPSPGDPR